MNEQTLNKLLSKTSGIWKDQKIDGLEYVRKLRDEWNRRCRKLHGSLNAHRTTRVN